MDVDLDNTMGEIFEAARFTTIPANPGFAIVTPMHGDEEVSSCPVVAWLIDPAQPHLAPIPVGPEGHPLGHRNWAVECPEDQGYKPVIDPHCGTVCRDREDWLRYLAEEREAKAKTA